MEDAVEGPVERERLGDVVLDEREALSPCERLDVAVRPRDEVVQTDHFVAVVEQPVGEVRAQEARRARNENPHDAFSAAPVPTGSRPMEWYSKPRRAICSGA